MPEQRIYLRDALNQAFKEEMRRDKDVVMWGEDLISMGGTTQGILEEFGPNRIKDTPIVEVAIVEMAVGAALTGLRPIAHIMLAGFVPLCGDALFLKLGSYYQEFNYKGKLPVVIFSQVAGGGGIGPDHALSPEAILIHSPGLKIVMPSTAYDAKGLLKASIRDDYPVVFLTHLPIQGGFGIGREAIPSEEYVIPLGKADVKREGTDITIVTYSAMVFNSLVAAEKLGNEGIDVEVVDLRCLVPMDVDAIVQSVDKTRRLVIAHEAMKRGGAAGEIVFRLMEAAPGLVKTLKSPVKRVAGKNVSTPRGSVESKIIPQIDDIVDTVKEMVG